ncbi:MAG: hypothetical protein NWQ13_00505 [Glaciimonas sp.]|nr:hypothetical protein [Glaciimonas sp.]
MSSVDYQRPSKLYRYSDQLRLERSLTLGEFRLRPPIEGLQIQSLHHGRTAIQLLTLSLCSTFNASLFATFGDNDCCLVINNPEEFGERVHRAAQRMLPNWAGIDGAISYGKQSPLGTAFTKTQLEASQNEWLFAWRPAQPTIALRPVIIQIGNIEKIAELRNRDAKIVTE